MCGHVHISMYMCLCVCVHVCKHVEGVILYHLQPHFLRHCPSLEPTPTNWTDWLANDPSPSSPTTLDLYVHSHKQNLTWVLRI